MVIVNWNTKALLAECLQSLQENLADLSFEIWVVDNASTDGSLKMLQERFPGVKVIANEENVGFAAANNQACQASSGKYMLLINSDARVTPGAVPSLVELARSEKAAGIVGGQLRNPDGSFQTSHTPFPTLGREFMILSGLGRLLFGYWYPSKGPEDSQGPQIVDYIDGACMLVNRQAQEQIGGLDESFFMYSEEVDWCFRMARADWQVWYQPVARIIHHGGASSTGRRTGREADIYRSRIHFFRKNYGDGSARLLKGLIVLMTAVKIPAHALVRLFSGKKKGRPVVPMGDLINALRDA